MTILLQLLLLLFASGCSTLDPLNEFAISGQTKEMRAYIDANPESVNKKNAELGFYPLEYSINFINLNRHVDGFKLLLEKGARFDVIKHEKGKPVSAMELVAFKHNIEAMESLIQAGEKRRSAEAFHNALECRRAENTMIISGATQSDTKYIRDELGFIKWMLKNGWNVHQRLDDGTTPVMTAIENCSLDIVKYLVKNGAKLNEKNDLGFDALYFAARSKNSETLKYVLNKGFKAKNKKYTSSDLNLLHVLIKNYRAYSDKDEAEVVKMIEMLVKEGVDINGKEKENLYTPLTWAAYHGSEAFVVKLIQLGADINPLTNKGETPLDTTVLPPILSNQRVLEKILMNSGGVYRRYRPQKKVAKVEQEDNSAWAIIGGLGASAVGFKSGLSEAASVEIGTRMARDIKDDKVTIDNFKADQSLMPKKSSPSNTSSNTQKPTPANSSKLKVGSKDFNVDKKARAQFAGTYANTYFDKSTADYRYVLNSDGTAKLYTRACETCTHDLQGQSMSREWKESYQAIEWAPMLDDKNKPLVVQVKDMYDKSYQARILLVILQGGQTMTLKHYTDNQGPALLGSYGVALYKN